MKQQSTPGDGRRVVTQDPLFSPTALTFRRGWQQSTGAACFEFFWARNAIFHGLRALGIRPGEKVLVPAYLCTAAIEPIEYFGAEVEFYAIQRNCVPDWSDLERRICGNVRAILAVHYFGFPCDVEKFCALRDQHNVFLIEDCAHVLEGVPSEHRFGEFGDISVFSPRKNLPVFDGGRLRINRPAPGFEVHFQVESPLFTLRVAKNLFERRHPPPASHLAPSLVSKSVPERTERDLAVNQGRPEKPLYVFPNSTSFLPWMADFPMSRLSRLLLKHFPILSIASKRRTNYSALLEMVSQLEGVRPLFEGLAAGVVPWVLPVVIGERRDAHAVLRAQGIPAVTWGGVRDPRISAKEFSGADFLYERLVFLPVHQDLETAHLNLIADAVAEICRAS